MDFKIAKFHGETELTDLAVIQLGAGSTNFFAFGTRADDFTRFKYESGCLRLSYAHDTSSESLRIILRVLRLKSDLTQIQLAIQAECADEVLQLRSAR